jgi:hypothetical protein
MWRYCLRREQGLTGNNDELCLDCWLNTDDREQFVPRYAYFDRRECAEENCLSEEEFYAFLHKEKRDKSAQLAGSEVSQRSHESP